MREFAENSIQYTDILDKFDVYIMPSMNPDGYEYTRSYNRMWRKTRSNNPGYRCKGVDPNRNWGYNWGLKGASTNPCDGNPIILNRVGNRFFWMINSEQKG